MPEINLGNSKSVTLLSRKFEEAKLRNQRLSQRAFAARIGLSSGALCEILKGKRALSAQVKKKLAGKLQFSPLEQAEFFESELPESLKKTRLEYFRVSTDQFKLISDWWHFAILNLIGTNNFKPSLEWIALRLDLNVNQVEEAWTRLKSLGHIKKVGKKIVRSHPRLETSQDLFDLSIQKSHLEDTMLIENSISNIPIELRDHTSMTFVMNKKDIPKAKTLISQFQDQFSKEIEVANGEEVYRISVSLFPLTKVVPDQTKPKKANK